MKIKALQGLVLCFGMTPLYANGGGYSYGVNFTGGIAPFTAEGTQHVEILDEKLDIYLGKEEAKVEVVYRMKNHSAGNVKVKFGLSV